MNLLKAAASVSAMTLVSRITGFARDVLLAGARDEGRLLVLVGRAVADDRLAPVDLRAQAGATAENPRG